ncbi:conserved hypothetical protein [Desulfosarcina cetonica]|uniref:type VI secretion system-associated FHA domain protein n=1 Tax=Desulfosarcina cetonica TaxID=90730 RepID=UPI0006D25F48|nr:type VI secretion system-associated FHA domain protein [Desulfosarcina cetonica]VTR64250.1 conserved hypothetical protein [Desulfosarcina cetonica]
MVEAVLIERIADALAQLPKGDENVAIDDVEACLERQMAGLDRSSRVQALKRLIDRLPPPTAAPAGDPADDDVLTGVCSLLLGRKVSPADLSSNELLEKLAESLNTIFNILNQLISVINMTFTGEGSPEQTIRQVIGYRLAGEGQGESLETYLGQISSAFLTSQQAFKDAAVAKVEQVLSVLDPQQIAAEAGKGLRFGALKKAEMFDIYEHRYQQIQKWFQSGRFIEDFLREFEKNCQTHFAKQGG